jgi:DNA-binding transcriptional ArsR family regulator
MRTNTEAARRLDRMFFALADVHRRSMLDRLSLGPASVSELAEPLGIALPSAVKHLAVLEQGGFVVSRKLGRVRTFTVEPRALDAMERWLATHKAHLHAQFDRLDAYLAKQQGTVPR